MFSKDERAHLKYALNINIKHLNGDTNESLNGDCNAHNFPSKNLSKNFCFT